MLLLGGLVAFTRLFFCVFCFCDFFQPVCRKFHRKFLGAHRTRRAPLVLGLMSRTLELSDIFDTPSGVKTSSDWRSRLMVGVVSLQMKGTSWGILPYRWPGRWSPWYLCWEVCITPFRRYLFWRSSYFGEKKRGIRSFITNSYFSLISVPISQFFC